MALYFVLTAFFFLLLLMGLRQDSQIVADCWPEAPGELFARRNLRVSRSFAFFALALLWFFTAFRSAKIGNDTANYIYYFRIFADSGIDTSRSFELGYQALNVLIGFFSKDPHVFLIVIATILYLGTGLYFYKFAKNILITVVLFYSVCFSLYVNIFRQGIAMLIVLYAYQLIKRKKTLPAALLIAAAAMFHTSAIICFALFFVPDKLLKKRLLVITAALICAALSFSGILNSLFSIILPRYAHYFSSRYASSGWLAVSYSVVRNLIWYLFISAAVDPDDPDEKLVLSNFTLLLMLSVFGYAVNLFTRVGEYFLLIGITELPNIFYNGRIKNNRLWLFLICTVMLGAFLVILLLRPDWNHLYPYEFWTEKIIAQ